MFNFLDFNWKTFSPERWSTPIAAPDQKIRSLILKSNPNAKLQKPRTIG